MRAGLLKRLKVILGGKSGVSLLLVIDVTLPLLLIFYGVSEYFRLQTIAAGARDAVGDTIISMVNGDYTGVYHGAQEEYSGGCVPYEEGEWEEMLDKRNIYAGVDEVLRTRKSGGRHVKFAEDSGNVAEFALTGLNIAFRNAPLASSDLGNAQCFEAKAVTRLGIPVQFGRELLSSTHTVSRVQAGCIGTF